MKICLWELTKIIQVLPDKTILRLYINSQELRDTPRNWTVKITELGI